MAKKKFEIKFDFSGIQAQFQGLQGRHPGLWPNLPKAALVTGLVTGLLVLAYFFYWSGLLDELENGRQQEVTLKAAYGLILRTVEKPGRMLS